MDSEKPKALIIGAGIAGLAAAWWLRKAGWDSVVVERSPAVRDGGYMMSLSGPGLETIKRMGLFDKVSEVAHRLRENIMHDQRGHEMLRLQYEDFHGGTEGTAICRGDLARVLREALPEDAVRYGETVTEITADDDEDKVHATLTSGEKLTVDLLLGADGIRSSIRDRFWKGEDCLEQLGYSYAAYDIAFAKKLQADCVSFNCPGYLATVYSLGEDQKAALHIWRNPQAGPQDRENKMEAVRKIGANGPALVTEVVAPFESASSLVIDDLTMVTLKRWSKGRVLLLGDSAHCLTLISGQGACMAVASAEILASELMKTNNDVAKALAKHEKRLRPVIQSLQAHTRKIAPVYIPAGTLKYHLRNLFLRVMPYSWIVSWYKKSATGEIDLTQALKD